MKAALVLLSVIATTITIFLTANVIYPTRSEVEARVVSLKERLDRLHVDVRELNKKADCIKDMLIERYKVK